jgi:ubiquinone/menaquinone biosynthesis C-methylase UbiE
MAGGVERGGGEIKGPRHGRGRARDHGAPLSAARQAGFRFDDIAAFDDIALQTFLDPLDGGIDPEQLGLAAAGCGSALVERLAWCLPGVAAQRFLAAARSTPSRTVVDRARGEVLAQLFWPLVYWTRPHDYEELIRGEHIADRVLDELDLAGKDVCDIGAGTGRFALAAARRARRVVAVDAVPALLRRLRSAARTEHLANVETRRGSFRALPVPDHSVDLAVACSSFTTAGVHGGALAVREAERIVRPGGAVAIIWPQQPRWFLARGYEHIVVRGWGALRFRDVATAERLCLTYYSSAAARWVREHRAPDVPYEVLGVSPPNDVCIKRIAATPSP